MRRLPASFQGPLEDRPPVSDFKEALRWLVRAYDLAERPLGKDEALPEAGFLVCDLFWITEKTLRANLAEYARQYWEISLPRHPRRRFSRGGR